MEAECSSACAVESMDWCLHWGDSYCAGTFNKFFTNRCSAPLMLCSFVYAFELWKEENIKRCCIVLELFQYWKEK